MLKVGIVGLPNVGKSTLFSALTKKQVDCENFPFCTIEPNVGVVEVPDDRLKVLAEISKAQKMIGAAIEFVDIAGLVKGAHAGEGLGNKFLTNIRETDMIAHVVRGFESSDIHHVDGSVDPVRDVEVIELELALADLAAVDKRFESLERKARGGLEKHEGHLLEALRKIKSELDAGRMASVATLTAEEQKAMHEMPLLTMKDILYIVNVSEEDVKNSAWESPLGPDRAAIPVCVKIEAEIATLEGDDANMFMEEYGLTESGLDRVIKAAYKKLGLMTYFTSGEKETRAWTISEGMKAPQAAGVIHTDFEEGFIRSETVSYADFVALGGWTGARDAGKARVEGKEYVMQDGDVCLFRFAN